MQPPGPVDCTVAVGLWSLGALFYRPERFAGRARLHALSEAGGVPAQPGGWRQVQPSLRAPHLVYLRASFATHIHAQHHHHRHHQGMLSDLRAAEPGAVVLLHAW